MPGGPYAKKRKENPQSSHSATPAGPPAEGLSPAARDLLRAVREGPWGPAHEPPGPAPEPLYLKAVLPDGAKLGPEDDDGIRQIVLPPPPRMFGVTGERLEEMRSYLIGELAIMSEERERTI